MVERHIRQSLAMARPIVERDPWVIPNKFRVSKTEAGDGEAIPSLFSRASRGSGVFRDGGSLMPAHPAPGLRGAGPPPGRTS